MLHYFKKGLNPSLVDCISTSFPIPTNLADYKQHAVVMQNPWKAEQHKKAIWCFGGWGTTLTSVPRPTPAPQALAPNMGVLMDVNTFRHPDAQLNPPALPRLTAFEQEILRCCGACFKCRQTGHISNDCPMHDPVPGWNVCITKVIAPCAPSTSMFNTSTSTQVDAVQQISVMTNLLWTLQGDAKEQAIAYLKDVISLDF